MTVAVLVVELVGGNPLPQSGAAGRRRARLCRHRGADPGLRRDESGRTRPDRPPHVRPVPRGNPGRVRQRRSAAGGFPRGDLRGRSPLRPSQGHSHRHDAGPGGRRARRKPRFHAGPGSGEGRQPEPAGRVPGGPDRRPRRACRGRGGAGDPGHRMGVARPAPCPQRSPCTSFRARSRSCGSPRTSCWRVRPGRSTRRRCAATSARCPAWRKCTISISGRSPRGSTPPACTSGPASDSPRGELLGAVQELLRDKAGVEHATIQVEWGAEMTCHASSREHA